jgi:hypothetical protein
MRCPARVLDVQNLFSQPDSVRWVPRLLTIVISSFMDLEILGFAKLVVTL